MDVEEIVALSVKHNVCYIERKNTTLKRHIRWTKSYHTAIYASQVLNR
jgi:hypothetical protein